MHLAEPQLGSVFASDDALVGRDEPGKDVEQSRLAGSSATRDDDVETGLDRGIEILEDRFARAASLDDLLGSQHLATELADGQARPVDRDGRNDDVDSRSVLQPRITHGLRLVDATPDCGDDPVDHAAQACLVLEGEIRQLDPAVALDEDLLRPVDHDLRDIRVAQRRFEWTEPDDLVEEDLDQALAVGRGDERGRRLEPEVLVGELREQAPDAGPVRDVDRRCVPAQEVGMDLRLRGSQRGTEDGRAVGVRRLQDGLAGRPLALHRAPFDRGDARRPVDWGLRCRDWRLRSGDWRLRLGDRGLRSGRRRLLVATVEPLGELHRGLPTARRRRRR